MDTDLSLIIGLCVFILGVPGILSAISDNRAPRSASVTLLIGGALVLYAITQHPGGYALADIPDVFYDVLGRFVN